MKKQYVPRTLTEFISESNSITLKRKYTSERPAITVGANAPLRNQVLSFVAENASVSKSDLKQYILGLREGGATVASANMFIKRNARYFVTESLNGVTYFKLSNLGQRLVNQFAPKQETNVSESFRNCRKSLNEKFEDPDVNRELDDEVPDDIEADDIDGEGPAENIEFDTETEDNVQQDSGDDFEYKEDDEKIVLTYYKNDKGAELPEDEVPKSKDLDDEDLDDDTGYNKRKFDFKDKGRPGLTDMDESTKAQFVSHALAGKKSSRLGGKLDPKLHNLLDDNEDKDENELKENEARIKRMKKIIENLKNKNQDESLNEADESDELADADLDTIDTGDEVETETDDDTATTLDGEENMEEVEITEFIITVDDVDSAIDELTELGVMAERVPVEALVEEVPAPEEEPAPEEAPVEAPAEGEEAAPAEPEAEAQKEAFKKFVAGILNEDE